MARRARRAIHLAGASIATAWILAACLDFGQLSDDSASPGADASTAETGSDAVDDFGGQPFDAGTGIEASFCAQNPGHTLCDDFDDDAWRAPWNLPDTLTPPGSIAIDSIGAASAPFSLETTNAPMDASAYAFLETKFPTTPSALHVAFDFNLVAGGSSSVAVTNILLAGQEGFALKLTQPSPPTLQVIEVTHPDAGTIVYSNVPGVSFTVIPGTWYHADFVFDLSDADAGEVHVTFNGGATIDTSTPVPLPVDPSQPFNLQAGVGSYSSPPYLPATVRLDNYVVDAK